MKSWRFLLPFCIGALLRILYVWDTALWYDENYTLAVIRLPWRDMLTAIIGDVHPPLYYVLLKPLACLPAPAWTLRLSSVALGIAALPLAWVVFSKLAGSERVRDVTFWLFALCTTAIYYSQEARMYALLTVLLLAAVWALLEGRWALLCLFSITTLYTQNYGLFYVPALWLAGMVMDRRNWKILTCSLGLAGLTFVPWLPVLFSQMGNLQAGYWITPFSPGFALYDLFRAFIQKGTFRFELFAFVIFIGWLCYAFWWSVLHRTRPQWAAATLALFPFVLAIAFSLASGSSVLHFRSFAPLAPFTALFLARPVSE